MWIRKDAHVHTKKGKRDYMNMKKSKLLAQWLKHSFSSKDSASNSVQNAYFITVVYVKCFVKKISTNLWKSVISPSKIGPIWKS